MLITLALIGLFVLMAPSAVEYFQPHDALVVFKPHDTEETLWNKLLSMWTISAPVVQIPEIWNGPQPTYPIMRMESAIESENFLGFIVGLIILCIATMIVYAYLCPEQRTKSPYAGKIVISELNIRARN